MRIKPVLLSLFVAAGTVAGAAHANLITNGNFEQTTNGTNKRLSDGNTTASNLTTLVGWTSSNGNSGGYNFVLNGSTATTSSAALQLRDFTAMTNGGNFFASDPLYGPGYLYQQVNGLTLGASYTLTFDYGMAQQAGFSGANNNDYWLVGFNNDSRTTTPLSSADGSFTGWKSASMTFTATGVSEYLYFLAKGDSPGAPPFMLLDNVSMTSAVPEPSTAALMLGGIGLLGLIARRRWKRQA